MWIVIPFLVQAVAIGLDEYIFHLKRGLPKWERIGHPLDTLSVLACVAFVLMVPYDSSLVKWYVVLAVISCLMITKDEFVHKHHCPAAEQWLHALLFVNHSIMLFAMGFMWPKIHGGEQGMKMFLLSQAVLIGLFCLYQIVYWNYLWKPSTTDSTTT